jgi:putative transposase
MHSLQGKTKMSWPKIIQQYKSSVTRKINSMQNDFEFRWQKSSYDHIIRSEQSLESIREYIQNKSFEMGFG